mgnify:CR=1 FL=1
MSTTAEQMRAWRGPAILTFGFRPFFLGAAVWAALAMVLWLMMLTGLGELPIRLDPVAWHSHEFLYGYVIAVIAGFLMTAVPNWTGRLPIVGWPLLVIVLLWVAGRVAMGVSEWLPPLLVALVDLSMPVALTLVIGREIVTGKNWRNLPPLAMLGVFTLGNAVFHIEAAQGAAAAQGYGLRIGLGASIALIGLIGGRIVPSFTRNWLVRREPGRLPVPPMQRFDKLALVVLVAAVLLWVALPHEPLTAVALLVAGLLHGVRLTRWAGERTLSEPLLWILHLAYAFVPLGALAIGVSILWPGVVGAAAAQHLWMAGALGMMTVAVMTRATLGHTGQTLTAGPGTVAIYAMLLVSVLARLAAGTWIGAADMLHHISGAGWIGAFGTFAAIYGPLVLRRRAAK